MCDPGSLIGTGASIAGKAIGGMGQASAARAQDQANKNHAMQQLLFQIAERNRQEMMGAQARAAWYAGLRDFGAGQQMARQSTEENRLAAFLNGDTGVNFAAAPRTPSLEIPDNGDMQAVDNSRGFTRYTNEPPPVQMPTTAPSVADGGFNDRVGLGGQASGGDVFKTDLAHKIAQAARDARGRINAMARVSSYGDSYGGLGTMNPIILQHAGSKIDQWNNFRKGSLQAYGVEQKIPATQIRAGSSPLGGIISGLGGALGKMAGGMGGGGMF